MKDMERVKERYEFSFDVRQLGLVLMAVVAIVALVFALGVSVGVQWERKKSGDTRQALTVSVGKPVQKARSAAAPPVPAAPPVLSPVTTNAQARVGKAQGTPSDSKAGAKAEKQEPPVALTFPKVLTSNTKNTAPLRGEKKTAEDSVRKYTVQVGAYSEKGAAKARVDKLKKKGYDARVYNAGGKKYAFKVRVGSFETRAEAAQTAKKLTAAEKVSPYITLEEM